LPATGTRIWDFFREGPQSCGKSARENGDGHVERGAHEIQQLGALEIKPEADFPEPVCRTALRSRALSST